MPKNIDSASSNTPSDNFARAPKLQSETDFSVKPKFHSENPRLPTPRPTEKKSGQILDNAIHKKSPKKYLKKILFIFLLAIFILGGLVFSRAANLSAKIFTGQKTTFFGKVWEAIRGISGNMILQGENKGQINILLLGIGGAGHEGPYLTDTMILAQIRPKTSEVAFISVPRDLLASLPNNSGDRKINSIFAESYAKTKNWDEAGRWTRMAVERLSGQTIPYFAVIDFEGFKKAIDEIGGVNIYVDRAFVDTQFPDEKLGYLPRLEFKQGFEQMNGGRALKYTRSRHGSNNEGSDFARGVRQQKVIKAFKEKVLKLNLITSANKINNLLGIFADNFHTNLSPGEIFRLYDIVKEQNIQTFLTLSLDPETGILCQGIQEETGAYILIPCQGKTTLDVQNFFKNAFILGKLFEEKSIIWLGNSTSNSAGYTAAEKKLRESNLTFFQLNYDKDDLPQTIIYQVNPKPATAEYLKNILEAKEVSLPPPGIKIDKEKVDIIVILGKQH